MDHNLYKLARKIEDIDGVKRAVVKCGKYCEKSLPQREIKVLEVEWKEHPNAYSKELEKVRENTPYKPLGKTITKSSFYTYYTATSKNNSIIEKIVRKIR